ncbi:PREDICTED: serine/threonine-protein phosphatase CPPED1-like isoform X2 [Priapulus caudatus]|uniref:Serine/threonine-protein phosphatase CPPED1-like isoform X2 n=1 Tax=Priapulus caudatus TaxID=37621 RepID=A0ABM1EWL0_PRICU|nr:PREDICTED: serine/threonine-protein phosphatase CPPED1-like isoform X2 [Priapulus caudatus]
MHLQVARKCKFFSKNCLHLDFKESQQGAGKSHKEAQEKDFIKLFSELDSDIPLVCVCGNHDIGNTPTHQSVQNYKATFGDDHFSFWVGGVHCIVLNSQFFKDASQVPDLLEEQDAWLDAELKQTGFQHRIVFQHIPWFLHEADEEDDYFSVDLRVRMRYLDKFKAHGVRTIFSGHYHRNAGGWFGEMEAPVTSAIGAQLGNDSSGMRVVTVTEDEVLHKYYALGDVPTKVDL